jgi:hypothetical protein
MVTM